MINIYLNQVERELDDLVLRQKATNDMLRIAEDTYSTIEETDGHEALKLVSLFNVLKRQNELEIIQKNIELANKTIKNLHLVRRTQWKERTIERTADDLEYGGSDPSI